MSIRHITGLIYTHIPSYSTGTCALCGRTRVRVEARVTPKPRARYKPGVIICGLCWEDREEEEIRSTVLGTAAPHFAEGKEIRK